MDKLNYNQVFKTTGVPSVTYVKRENQKYELELSSAIQSEGQLCLLTGPSKTGKTTLYTKVLEGLNLNPLIIRCDNELTVEEFWKKSLESIDFTRLVSRKESNTSEIAGNSKIKGKLGWSWLAEMVGEISLGVKSSTSEMEIREKVLSKPSPLHLLPILKYTKTVLVIEDFHYLTKQVQKTIFQQWKTFVDSEVSVLVIGTTHHGSDLVSANQDLLGRVVQIELNGWKKEDLKKIIEQGYKYLDIHITPMMKDIIAQESVGLPIITQTICRQLITDNLLDDLSLIKLSKTKIYTSLHNVAKTIYVQMESMYQIISTGPRKGARKYNTYEFILLIFGLDPLTFQLDRLEITTRLKELLKEKESKIPPEGSVNSTLKALSSFQKKNNIELLEWSNETHRLYILEPTFLFFIRWREERKTVPSLSDLLNEIFAGMVKSPLV